VSDSEAEFKMQLGELRKEAIPKFLLSSEDRIERDAAARSFSEKSSII